MIDKTVFVGYRDWSLSIHNLLDFKIPIVKSTVELLDYLKSNDTQNLIFVGWSEIIPDYIIDKYNCYCIHPSKLPKYRGGSPIQHQIINGEKMSCVSLFKMTSKLDSGPIIHQLSFSLEGDLSEIFKRIEKVSTVVVNDLLLKIQNNIEILSYEQDDSQATLYRRRKPHQSEISIEEIKNSTAEQLYNKIRALQDPYPNAYIKCSDDSKLYIKKAYL